MAGFAQATAVHDGKADLDPQWTVGGRPNGGYLLAVLANAAKTEQHPHPLSASAVYLAAPDVGPATVTVEPLRTGRTASQARARLAQQDRTCVEALFTFGHLDGSREQRWVDAPPPAVKPVTELFPTPVEAPGAGLHIEMLSAVDQRIDWDAVGDPPGELRGWLSFADGQPWDPIALLYAVDAFPPATFTLGSAGWTPTFELTVYVRAAPEPGPLRIRQRARVLTDSMVDQVCEVWDSAGRVVAQATQLAGYRMNAK